MAGWKPSPREHNLVGCVQLLSQKLQGRQILNEAGRKSLENPSSKLSKNTDITLRQRTVLCCWVYHDSQLISVSEFIPFPSELDLSQWSQNSLSKMCLILKLPCLKTLMNSTALITKSKPWVSEWRVHCLYLSSSLPRAPSRYRLW